VGSDRVREHADAGYLETEALRTFEFGLARMLDGVEHHVRAPA
jgi:hypothetical protein